jgi:hypothetical protein
MIVVGATLRNTYLLSIGGLLLARQIPEKILKAIAPNKYNQRPYGAENCNMINGGGSYESVGGVVSGHVTVTYIAKRKRCN